MSGEAVLVPLIWESISGVAGAVEATVAARKEAARREAEAQRARIQAWRDFQSQQEQIQSQQRLSLQAVQQARQQLINSGLRDAVTRIHGEAGATGFVGPGRERMDRRAVDLLSHIEQQLVALPDRLFDDQRLPFARLREHLRQLQQAAVPAIEEVESLGDTLQRSFADYVQRLEQEAEQGRRQMAVAEQLLSQLLELRVLSMDDEDAEALHRLQEELLSLLAERQLSPAALDVISNRIVGLRGKIERAVAANEMNDYLAERVTHHLNDLGYATVSAFSEQRRGQRRDAEFALPDGDRLRVALQADLRMGFQLSHETRTLVNKTLSGEALDFFRQQEARWCRDMKALIRRLVKDGVPYQVQFEREVPEASIPVVVMEGAGELLDGEDDDQRPRRRRKERHF